MDDGYKSVKGFYISTESFTLKENEFLVGILQNKFGLTCSVHKHTNGHRIYIASTSKDKFVELVKPYILPIFNYKLDLDSDK
jgi:hypothetical protein